MPEPESVYTEEAGLPIHAEWGLTPRRVKRRTLAAEAEVERLQMVLRLIAAEQPPANNAPAWRMFSLARKALKHGPSGRTEGTSSRR